MPSVAVNGGDVVYEIQGSAGDLIVLTRGGRFGKDIRGLRPLADALVDGGHRVLLWDRPNCGASELQFYGQSESHMRAEWPEDAWERSLEDFMKSNKENFAMFDTWVMAAPSHPEVPRSVATPICGRVSMGHRSLPQVPSGNAKLCVAWFGDELRRRRRVPPQPQLPARASAN